MLTEDAWLKRLIDGPVFVAFRHDDPVGIMRLSRQRASKMAHRARLIMVYVCRSERGGGCANHCWRRRWTMHERTVSGSWSSRSAVRIWLPYGVMSAKASMRPDEFPAVLCMTAERSMTSSWCGASRIRKPRVDIVERGSLAPSLDQEKAGRTPFIRPSMAVTFNPRRATAVRTSCAFHRSSSFLRFHGEER